MVYSIEERGYTHHTQLDTEGAHSAAGKTWTDTDVQPTDMLPDQANPNESERLIVIKESEPLARRRVLYLGAAIPSPDLIGVDSIQEPLAKRYAIQEGGHVCGIEAWLSIDENGLQIQFLDDLSMVLYYPIRSLIYCASVRYVKHAKNISDSARGCHFVPVEEPEADHVDNAENPPVFAVTLQRTRHSPAQECHCFVVKTKSAALELVKACVQAYHATDPTQDCSHVPAFFKIDSDGSGMAEVQRGIYIAPASSDEREVNYASSEYGSGFFYKTDRVTINCWLFTEHQRRNIRQNSSDQSSSSRSSRPPDPQPSHSSRPPAPESKPAASRSANRPNEQPTAKPDGPYTPVPEMGRVLRVKDAELGRDVFIRWLTNTPSAAEQIATPQKASYNVSPGLNLDYTTNKPLTKEINRLALPHHSDEGSTAHDSRAMAALANQEQKKAKKKHRKLLHPGYEIIEDYFIDSKPKQTKKTHRYPQQQPDQSITVPSSRFNEPQYPSSTQPQTYYSPHTVPHQEYVPSPYPADPFPARPYPYQEHPKSAYSPPQPQQQQQQQQQVPVPSFSQEDLSKLAFSPQRQPQIYMFPLDRKNFASPPFNGKSTAQSGPYTFHMLQPFGHANNASTASPYWYFAM